MSIRPRHVALSLAALLAALFLVACGGGDSSSGGDASKENVSQLLDDTFAAGKKVDSGNIVVAANVDLKGASGLNGPVAVKLDGPFQTQGKGKLPKFGLKLSLSSSGQQIAAGATSTGDKGFLNLGGTDYAVDDSVFKQFVQGYEKASADSDKSNKNQPSLSALGIDPKKWLKNPRKEGEGKVGNDDVVRITGDVDVPKLLDDLNNALGKAAKLGVSGATDLPQALTDAQKQQAAQAIKSLAIEIDTGKKDKILRRIKLNLVAEVPAAQQKSAGLQSANVAFDLQIQNVNTAQTITAPANAKPFSELAQALGGLGLGGLGGGGATGPTGASGSSGATGASGAGSSGSATDDKYIKCLTDAGSDLAKAQKCASLIGK